MPPSGPVPEDSEDDKQDPVIPVEILRMDDKSLQLYKNALRDGKEKIYNIRVMVVGQFGVGKTTLTKRLLGKPVYITERKSTEGIDVYKHCCKISLDTGEWIVQLEDSDQLSRLQRLMELLSGPDQKTDISQEQEGHREVVYERETTPEADNTQMSEAASISRSGQEDQMTYSQPAKLSAIKKDGGHGMAHSDQETSTVTVTKSEAESSNKERKDAVIEILHLINENADKLETDIVKYAALSIWDFAGQYAFYTTHQTFLSSRALYLLVIDLNQQITDVIKDDKCFLDMEGIKLCKVHDLVEIWMNSIHTCASSPEASIPHVVLVGTHVDKLSEKSRKQVIKKYFEELRYILKDKPTIRHLMDHIAIDNTQSDPMLEILKRKIFELASQQQHWGEERPARWLPLEQKIMTLKASGAKVVARSLIEEINMSGSVRIEDSDELDLFLIFHHEMGTILYFSVEGLREKIVLDPQWLIDALKSLITAETFIKKYPAYTSKWYKFEETGKLTHELIDAIWTEKNNQEFRDNKDHILLLMEKLNIIARPRSFTEDGNIKESNYFLAPCMLQQKAPAEVICPKPNDQMESSSVLCFVFIGNFMPSPIFHRLLAACIAHWPIATKNKEEKQENQIFCGCCVFELDQLHNLTLHFKEFIIFVRVTKMGIKDKTPSSKLCIEAREFINTNLLKIIGYLGQSLKFEYFIQCPEYSGESVNSLIPVSQLKENAEVRCKLHTNVIKSCNLLKFWFEDKEQTGDGDTSSVSFVPVLVGSPMTAPADIRTPAPQYGPTLATTSGTMPLSTCGPMPSPTAVVLQVPASGSKASTMAGPMQCPTSSSTTADVMQIQASSSTTGTKTRKRRLSDDQDESKQFLSKKQGTVGSASTSSVMAEQSIEAKAKHNELFVKLDERITQDALKKIKRMARTYLEPKPLEKVESMDDLLSVLEEKGLIGVGKYDVLIKIMTGANVIIGMDEIDKTARDIKDIMESSILNQE